MPLPCIGQHQTVVSADVRWSLNYRFSSVFMDDCLLAVRFQVLVKDPLAEHQARGSVTSFVIRDLDRRQRWSC
uniref:Uncharacterized protein n=1 Tax=Romanomermis culicivorax TaxID=13658 RepID=A0A915KBF5_ROMCU